VINDLGELVPYAKELFEWIFDLILKGGVNYE
jgi:hypothetical protein